MIKYSKPHHSTASRTILLFASEYFFAVDVVNRIVPALYNMGIRVVLVNTGDKRNRKIIVKEPAHITFFTYSIVRHVIFPFVEQESPCLDTNGKPIKGLLYSYEHLVKLFNVDYITLLDVNDPALLDRIIKDESIIGVVAVRFGQIFDCAIIDALLEKGFFWNLHGAILPKYKGLLLIYRAIQHHENEYGWTLHWINEGIDDGAIIDVCKIPFNPRQPILDTLFEMCPLGAEMLWRHIVLYINEGRVTRIYQDPSSESYYYSNPTDAEMHEFERKGIVFADSKAFPKQVAWKFCVAGTKRAKMLENLVAEAISKLTYTLPES